MAKKTIIGFGFSENNVGTWFIGFTGKLPENCISIDQGCTDTEVKSNFLSISEFIKNYKNVDSDEYFIIFDNAVLKFLEGQYDSVLELISFLKQDCSAKKVSLLFPLEYVGHCRTSIGERRSTYTCFNTTVVSPAKYFVVCPDHIVLHKMKQKFTEDGFSVHYRKFPYDLIIENYDSAKFTKQDKQWLCFKQF